MNFRMLFSNHDDSYILKYLFINRIIRNRFHRIILFISRGLNKYSSESHKRKIFVSYNSKIIKVQTFQATSNIQI